MFMHYSKTYFLTFFLNLAFLFVFFSFKKEMSSMTALSPPVPDNSAEDLTGRFQFPGLVVASFSLYMQNFKECEMYIYIYQKSTKKRALL